MDLRIFLVVAVLINLLCFSGIIFGWSPFMLMLQQEGQYDELCAAGEPTPCLAQNEALVMMFAIAVFLVGAVGIPAGLFLDAVGPRISVLVAGFINCAGLYFLANSDSKTNDHFYLGMGLLASGGQLTMLSSFPVSFVMKEHQTLILAAANCFFDACAFMLQAGFILYSAGWTRQSIFYGIIGMAIVSYTVVFCLWHIGLRVLRAEQDKMVDMNENTPLIGGSKKVSDMNMMEQLKTYEFGFSAFYATVNIFCANLFMGTVNERMIAYGDAAHDFYYTKMFGTIVPMGFLAIPAIDATIGCIGHSQVLLATIGLGVATYAVCTVHNLTVAILAFCLFTLWRAYIYAGLSAMVAETFGLNTMGRIMGVNLGLSSFFNIVQVQVVRWANGLAGNTNGSAYLAILLLIIVIPFWMIFNRRPSQQKDTMPLVQRVGSVNIGRMSYVHAPLMQDDEGYMRPSLVNR